MITQVNLAISLANNVMATKYGQDIGKFSIITDRTHMSEFYEVTQLGDIVMAYDFCTDNISDVAKLNEFNDDLNVFLQTLSDTVTKFYGLKCVDHFYGSSGDLYYGHTVFARSDA